MLTDRRDVRMDDHNVRLVVVVEHIMFVDSGEEWTLVMPVLDFAAPYFVESKHLGPPLSEMEVMALASS